MHDAAFHQGLDCLLKYQFRGFHSTKGQPDKLTFGAQSLVQALTVKHCILNNRSRGDIDVIKNGVSFILNVETRYCAIEIVKGKSPDTFHRKVLW